MSTSAFFRGAVLTLLTFAFAGAPAFAAAETHDVAWWRSIKAHGFEVPEGQAQGRLLLEVCGLLDSPDPEVRDGLGYEIAAAWIVGKRTVSNEELRPVIALLERNLSTGVGENGTGTVLGRSFSALVLSVVAARDNTAPFLTREEFDALLAAALDYLAREKDERGFVPGTGWHHSVAHTADLLKFLGRNPKLQTADQRRILAGISLKTGGSKIFWTWGEDDRLAAAVLSLLRRDDFDTAAFDGWSDRIVAVWQDTMQVIQRDPSALDPARYAAAKNGRDLLASLYVQVSTASPFANADRARATLATALKRM